MTGIRSECKSVLGEALANLRGETSAIEQERFHSHMENCPTCRDSVDDITQMVEVTRDQRFLPTQSARDEILTGLLAQIQGESSRNRERDGDWFKFLTQSLVKWRWLRVAAPVAAAAVFAIIFLTTTDQILPGEMSEVDNSMAEAMLTEPEPAHEKLPWGMGDGVPLHELQNRYLVEGLVVGVEPGSSFGFSESDKKISLTMEKGSMWIQYSPRDRQRSLIVHGAGVDVHVVGTVLTVRATPGEVMEVGVYEGKVLVEPDVGDSIVLKSQRWRSRDGVVGEIDLQLMHRAENWLGELNEKAASDKSAKRQRKRARTQKRRDRDRDSDGQVAARAQQSKSRADDLYSQADREMAEGNYKIASKYLEQLIKMHPHSRRADIARLDLARLYLDRLRNPSRAAHHLQIYLERHPRGSQSRLVKQRLCEIEKNTSINVNIRCDDVEN